MRTYSAFVNEHTVAYSLIPSLVSALERDFRLVTPLYFMATREGSRAAEVGWQLQEFQMISIFPRRPKIHPKETDVFMMKINQNVIERSLTLQTAGIPSFFAFPILHSAEDLHPDMDTRWFRLLSGAQEMVMQIPTDRNEHIGHPFVKEINQQEIVEEAKKARLFSSWKDACGHLKSPSVHQSRFSFSYKPILFVLR